MPPGMDGLQTQVEPGLCLMAVDCLPIDYIRIEFQTREVLSDVPYHLTGPTLYFLHLVHSENNYSREYSIIWSEQHGLY